MNCLKSLCLWQSSSILVYRYWMNSTILPHVILIMINKNCNYQTNYITSWYFVVTSCANFGRGCHSLLIIRQEQILLCSQAALCHDTVGYQYRRFGGVSHNYLKICISYFQIFWMNDLCDLDCNLLEKVDRPNSCSNIWCYMLQQCRHKSPPEQQSSLGNFKWWLEDI